MSEFSELTHYVDSRWYGRADDRERIRTQKDDKGDCEGDGSDLFQAIHRLQSDVQGGKDPGEMTG